MPPVVFATEHLLDLGSLDFQIERVERLGKLRVNRLALLRPLAKDGQVLALSPERRDEVAILFEPAAALQGLLRFCLVLPEVRSGGTRLEAGQFFVRPGGFKDSSADRPLAW